MASAAVLPLPPARVGDEHYLDGGIVNSIPVGRAVQLGATRVFVLQVGRIDRPLSVPRRPWEVARVSFEIARRHRFAGRWPSCPTASRRTCCPRGARRAATTRCSAAATSPGVQQRMDDTQAATAAYLDGLSGPA